MKNIGKTIISDHNWHKNLISIQTLVQLLSVCLIVSLPGLTQATQQVAQPILQKDNLQSGYSSDSSASPLFQNLDLTKININRQHELAQTFNSLNKNQRLSSSSYNFKLKQESAYDGYTVLEEPFTSTDQYLYMDAFFVGLKLDDWYQYSDTCLNSIVFTLDDNAYYKNNRTLVEEDPKENWFHTLLNFTGAMAGPASDIPPQCYMFIKSVRTRETERWEEFDKSWSNFFIAFLFNQMGNALNFQQKFENIRINKEEQNYQGVWLEYGDLLHIIWDFEPLEDEEASLMTMDEYIANFVNETIASKSKSLESPIEVYVLLKSITYLTNHFISKADIFMPQAINLLQSKLIDPIKSQASYQHQQAIKLLAPPFESSPDTGFFLYGLINGAVNVFPIDSLPDLCRDNTTSLSKTFDDLFLEYSYNFEEGEDVELAEDIQAMMQYPYGLCFSCFFAFTQIFITDDAEYAEPGGEWTDEDALSASIVIYDDVVTNVFFNAGYMYQDIANFLQLEDSREEYYKYVGYYLGDFLIRFWWHNSYTTTFQYQTVKACYPEIEDCDDEDYQFGNFIVQYQSWTDSYNPADTAFDFV